MLNSFECSEVESELSAAIILEGAGLSSILYIVAFEPKLLFSSIITHRTSKDGVRRTTLSKGATISLVVDTGGGSQRRVPGKCAGGQLGVGAFGPGSDLGEHPEENIEVEKSSFEV